jgi:hypothetical protein
MANRNIKDKKNIFAFYFDEVVNRDFKFTLFMIVIVVGLRNQYNGHDFHLKVDVDLFFELVLLLVPIALLVLRHKSDNEIANIFERKSTLIFFIAICIIQTVFGIMIVNATNYAFPVLDIVLELLGLFVLITAILNLIIGLLMIVLKLDKAQNNKKRAKH